MKLLTVDYPEQNVCQMTFSATAEELEAAANVVYENKRSSFTIKGFEKGEANRAEIEADRGEHTFWYDAINDIMDAEVTALYEGAIAELSLDVVNEPSYDLVSVNKEDGFTATATCCLQPEFVLGDYKSIAVTETPSTVTEEQIKHYMERKQRLNAELVPHKGPAVKGNIVHITYVGFADDKAFEGGSAENQELTLGSGRMIPGFEEGIIGHSAGDSFDIDVTFPAQYGNKALAGQKAVFKTKLLDACVKEIPAINSDLVKKITQEGSTTVEEYHEEVKKFLEKLRYNNAMNKAKGSVLAALDTLVTGEVPEPLVAQAYAADLQSMQEMLQQQRATKAQYLKMIGKTDEEFTAEMRERAARGVRVGLALHQIAKLENLVPTDDEITEEIKTRAEAAKKDYEEINAKVNRRSYSINMARKRAVDFVTEKATITITEPAK